MDAGADDDLYALLGVAADAGDEELHRAWRRLAWRWHPDRAGDGGTAPFQRILAAYSVLAAPAARAAYDRRRSAGPAPERRRAPAVMLQRVSGSLRALLACGIARRAEAGVIELRLDADEAATGGHVTISMRVDVRCPACAAAGGACGRCGGTGTIDELYSAWLAVPPGIADGTVLAPSSSLAGLARPPAFRVRLGGGAP